MRLWIGGRGVFLSFQLPSPTTITRKARFWPEIPREKLVLPIPPSFSNTRNFTPLITIFFSTAGMGVYAYILSHQMGGAGMFYFSILIISGFMALGTLMSFIIQWLIARRKSRYLLKIYTQKLNEVEQKARALQRQERQARIDLDPPLFLMSKQGYEGLNVQPLIKQPFNDQNVSLWARRPEDPDFLQLRIGMGSRPASYQITGQSQEQAVTLPSRFEKSKAYARQIVETFGQVPAPVTIRLDKRGPVAISSIEPELHTARDLARNLVSQLAYHHSPDDVRIIILAPAAQQAAWQWTLSLPHTQFYDPRQSEDEPDETKGVALNTGEVIEILPLISREMGRRELLWGDDPQKRKAMLPRLIIVVDHFDITNDLDQPTGYIPIIRPGQSEPVSSRPRLLVSPLRRGEMTLALTHGHELGVSVLCLNSHQADIPTTSSIVIDLDTTQAEGKHRAYIRTLQPEPPPMVPCTALDWAPVETFSYLAAHLQKLRPASTRRMEIRTQVDVRSLFEPALDLAHYQPQVCWGSSEFRAFTLSKGQVPQLRIPIGMKIGDEIQYLDFLRDGPHGLLIGQTGSGKSELLQTIITSLAVTYRPTEVVLLLIDYKAGLALEPFRELPHTVGFLSNMSSPALIQRFITMLKAEATRRELLLKEGKQMPRLIIIIDEFAEMAKRTEAVLEELFTITRVGREIGMHLLLSAQRPEGIIGNKVRDYVQYRLCLRCASNMDSREVIGRIDAANLPASIPGRGYLLHGDNQLDLFQAARVTLPAHRE